MEQQGNSQSLPVCDYHENIYLSVQTFMDWAVSQAVLEVKTRLTLK